jgi:hypothetical protein
MPMLRSIFLASFVSTFAATHALASTLVVDANGGPGAQFLDIGSAVAAAAPGDVILVHAGTYPAFVSSKGLTILGQGAVIVNGQIALVGVPQFERSALLALQTQSLIVDSCSGPVLVQDVQVHGELRSISTPDLRLRNVSNTPPQGAPTNGFSVESTRAEIVGCTLRGSSGLSNGESGGNGLVAYSGATLHVVASDMTGGSGQDTQTTSVSAGGGGTGTALVNSSALHIVGGSSRGGYGGICWAPQCASDCSYDGPAGGGIIGLNGTDLFYSASTVATGASFYYGIHCVLLMTGAIVGSHAVMVSPDEPTLDTSGSNGPGQPVTFTLHGTPGSQATMWIGRGLIVQSTPPIAIDLLVPQARVFALGVVPASGVVSRTFTIPATLPTGFAFAAQGQEILSSGEIRRTNSAPIVVH